MGRSKVTQEEDAGAVQAEAGRPFSWKASTWMPSLSGIGVPLYLCISETINSSLGWLAGWERERERQEFANPERPENICSLTKFYLVRRSVESGKYSATRFLKSEETSVVQRSGRKQSFSREGLWVFPRAFTFSVCVISCVTAGKLLLSVRHRGRITPWS